MEQRFARQLKKGVLEMLVLEAICRRSSYGYELMMDLSRRSGGLFALKEGTLYPILYRLEDDGMIEAAWSAGEGRTSPKKIYTATEAGRAAAKRQRALWKQFSDAVNDFYQEETV